MEILSLSFINFYCKTRVIIFKQLKDVVREFHVITLVFMVVYTSSHHTYLKVFNTDSIPSNHYKFLFFLYHILPLMKCIDT